MKLYETIVCKYIYIRSQGMLKKDRNKLGIQWNEMVLGINYGANGGK